MSDNPFGIIEELSEAEKAQYDALDRTPPPAMLAKEWRQHATVGWTKRYVDTHARWCPSLRVLRRLGVSALILMGVVLTLNVVGVIAAKSLFRSAVRQVLIEQNLIHSQEVRKRDGLIEASR
jgi:hypothetical protein